MPTLTETRLKPVGWGELPNRNDRQPHAKRPRCASPLRVIQAIGDHLLPSKPLSFPKQVRPHPAFRLAAGLADLDFLAAFAGFSAGVR